MCNLSKMYYADGEVKGFKEGKVEGFAEGIRKLYDSEEDRMRMGAYNREQVKRFDIGCTNEIMKRIYTSV